MFKKKDFIIDMDKYHIVKFTLYKRTSNRKTSIPTTKEMEKLTVKHFKNQFCYRNLVEGIEEYDVNSLVAYFKFNKKLGSDKVLRWLKAAKQNGYLPKYVNVKDIASQGKLALSTARHTNNELYVFLSIVRFLQAEPAIVYNSMVFIDTGVDFDKALLSASKISTDNTNHHFIPKSWCDAYLVNIETMLEASISLGKVVALRTFINTMHSMELKHEHFTGFTCNMHMSEIYDNDKTEGSFIPKYL